jgi:hypothetical protein
MSRPLLAGLALLSALGGATEALAQANTVESRNFARWRAVDKCVADATKAFPDHDLVSLQKRDGQTDQCLADHKLPPRTHLAPDSPAPAIVEPPKEN